ncbi:MAG: hypothetical protein LBL92_04660 [Propionibacteriaceae bacterium]|jgi:hypothetical protein|nr:hypothetical protein [Propionibacteriaceae bacterium]
MAVVVLCSAGGSPGVTTAVVGLALAWPRPVVVIEADPTGASAIVPGFLQGQQIPNHSVIDLAIAQQQGHLSQTLLALTTPLGQSTASFIPAVKAHRQAAVMASVWEPLMDELLGLDRAGMDVLIDAGRLGLEWFPTPLVVRSTATVMVTRCTLPAIAAARVWTPWLPVVQEQQATVVGLGLVNPGQTYSAREISRYLKLRSLLSLPHDPAGARVFAEGATPRRRRFARSPLVQAFRSEAASLARLGDDWAGRALDEPAVSLTDAAEPAVTASPVGVIRGGWDV